MTARKITNLKFWGRPMVKLASHYRLRLTSLIGSPVVRIFETKRGSTAWDILGLEPRTFKSKGGESAARNAAQRYLEKLAADIARESVKR